LSHSPHVSIVVPFLNPGDFLREALDSVFAQTYENWELYLVDDGSTDDSTDLARDLCAGMLALQEQRHGDAVRHARQAVSRAIADKSRTIRIPVHMVEKLNQVVQTERMLVQRIGREPRVEEIAAELGFPVAEVREIQRIAQTRRAAPDAIEERGIAYRRKVKQLHPDRGGDRREFMRLQAHFEQAMAFVEGNSS